jgi:serralysin
LASRHCTNVETFTGSQLWRLRFNDVTNPLAGGKIEVLINGQNVAKMLDNITIDKLGRIVMQEDVGNNPRLGKVWMYDVASGALVELGQHNPALFTNPYVSGSNSLPTQDEESSGVIDVSDVLGEGTYLLDVQAHYPNANPALVEGGQLLLMRTGAIAGLGYDAASITAATPATPNALVVLGTSGNDHVEVTQSGTTFNVRVGDALLATRTGAIDRIFAVGYDGNDHVDLSGAQADASVFGGAGNDHLIGSSGANHLNGGKGNDHLDVSASTKVNRLEGGAGNDQFVAADTDVLIDFGVGNDKLKKKKK